ncbi:MAG: hydrolase [Phycisphaerae bacterium]|nr:MAG: hydrolase [Phycisphaerae bacterium]
MSNEVNADCVFCKIVAGEIPCHQIFSNDVVLAFLDIGPVSAGHVLLIPKRHCDSIVDLPSDVASAIGETLPRLARAVIDTVSADGLNVLQNNGECAGQVVNHAHFHLIPRTKDDGLGYRWRSGEYRAGEAEQLCGKISGSLAGQ